MKLVILGGLSAVLIGSLCLTAAFGGPWGDWLHPAFVMSLGLAAFAGTVAVLARARLAAVPAALAGAVLGLAFAALFPILALAQEAGSTIVPVGDVFADLRSTIEVVIGTVLMAIVGFLSWLMKRYLGIGIEGRMREALQSALKGGVHYALDAARPRPRAPRSTFASELIAQGIGYVRRYAPAAVGHFKLSDEDLDRMLRSKFTEIQQAKIQTGIILPDGISPLPLRGVDGSVEMFTDGIAALHADRSKPKT